MKNKAAKKSEDANLLSSVIPAQLENSETSSDSKNGSETSDAESETNVKVEDDSKDSTGVTSYTLKVADESEAPPFVVSFPNDKAPNANSSLMFACQTSTKGKRDRKKRVITGRDDKIDYVGTNFGTGGSEMLDLCNFIVAVRDKQKKQLKLYPAGHCFSLKSEVRGLVKSEELSELLTLAPDASYQERREAVTSSFGSRRKQKLAKATAASQINAASVLGMRALEHGFVSNANEDDEDLANAKALENAADEASTTFRLTFLPVNHPEATTVEGAYLLDEIIAIDVLREIRSEFDSFTVKEWIDYTLNKEDTLRVGGGSKHYKEKLLQLKDSGASESKLKKYASPLMYFGYMMAFMKAPLKIWTFDPHSFLSETYGIPDFVCQDLLEKFAEVNDATEYRKSDFFKLKLQVHALCVALLLNQYSLSLVQISADMGIELEKGAKLAKELGCNVTRQHVAVLKVPLVFPKVLSRKRGR